MGSHFLVGTKDNPFSRRFKIGWEGARSDKFIVEKFNLRFFDSGSVGGGGSEGIKNESYVLKRQFF